MTHVRNRINRRAFLVAAGTTGVALPFLEGLPERSAFAQTGAKPVFGLFIGASCGVQQKYNSEPESFWPTAFGPLTKEGMEAFAAERSTGVLAQHASRLLIISGVSHPQNGPSACGHAEGLAQNLTGVKPSGSGRGASGGGPSIDNVVASALNPSGVAPLNVYAGGKTGYIDDRLSFSAAGKVRAAEQNPYNVYTRLAGLLDTSSPDPNPTPSPVADQLALRRKSVNDLIREQINALKVNPKLSRADQERLQLHFDSIRDVETGMQDMGAGVGVECSGASLDKTALEAINKGSAFKTNENREKVVKLHGDLVGLTFSCNANRVATLQAGDGTDATQYTIDGKLHENFHHISHRVNSDGTGGSAIAGAAELHAKIDRIRMGTLSSIIDKWSELSTPDGPLLDNGFIYWTTHVAIGPSHSMANMPIIIAGSAGGALKQGEYIDGKGNQNGAVLTALLRAFGISSDLGSAGPFSGMLKA
jgi:hypothetical protein